MYDSPITKVIYDAQSEFSKQEEACIMATIKQTVGYSVDKEELIKALAYDRQQYDKGYEDALAEVSEIIKDILVAPTPHNRPIKDTRRQAVYDAMYEIEKLVRR